MDGIQEYITFIQELERLKNVTRTAWSSEGRRESTAEHSWRLAVLAGIMLEKFPELDGLKVLMMALLHDMGELYGGDTPAIQQPDRLMKYQEESETVKRAAGILKEPLRGKLINLWEEYEECRTPEARLVKALDKAETIIQHNQGLNPEGFDYEFNLCYGEKLFRDNEILRALRSRIDADTRLRCGERKTTDA